MKKIILTIILILFIFLIGLYQSASTSRANNLGHQSGSGVNDLSTLLLIVTDNLNDPDAQLLSIWQITINPLESEIKIVSVYPSENRNTNYSLVTSFDNSLDVDLNKEFVKEISKSNIFWEYYILVDPGGLADLIEFASNANFGSSRIDKNSIREQLMDNPRDPETAFRTQLSLFRQVCLSPITGISNTDLRTLFTMATVKTNLSPNSPPSEWEDLNQVDTSLFCKFDFLEP